MILAIDHLDIFRRPVADKKEIRFQVLPNGITVACYMFADQHTFNSPEARECRGIAFDANGHVISRPLHKFFNVGEQEALSLDRVCAREDLVAIYEKLDGSMIATAWVDGQLAWRSKKAFTSGVVRLTEDFLALPEQAETLAFATRVAASGHTAIFELTHPEARIVVGCDRPQLRLLHVRHNQTGAYVLLDPHHPIHGWVTEHRVPQVPKLASGEACHDVLQGFLADLDRIENREGVVLQFADGDMVKLKCPWYTRMHRAVTFLRERDIARLALTGALDDVKGMLSTLGITLADVEAVEERVREALTQITDTVETMAQQGRHMDRKEFALTHRAHPLFGLAMETYLGKEPDILDWYTRNRLKEDFSLRVLGGEAFAEALEG